MAKEAKTEEQTPAQEETLAEQVIRHDRVLTKLDIAVAGSVVFFIGCMSFAVWKLQTTSALHEKNIVQILDILNENELIQYTK